MNRLQNFFYVLILLALPAHASAGDSQDAYEHYERANHLASAGAYSRSISHYEKVLELAPDEYSLAFFNLAAVLRHKKKTAQAVVLYKAFLHYATDPTEKRDAELAIRECRAGSVWPTLTVQPVPIGGATIKINGHILSTGTAIEKMALPRGEYNLEIQVTDYQPFSQTIKLTADDHQIIDPSLEKIIYFGNLHVETAAEGAKIIIHETGDPKSPIIAEFEGNQPTPIKVREGKHFVEVTGDDYRRWIRNVVVPRNGDVKVVATLKRSIPKEIQF